MSQTIVSNDHQVHVDVHVDGHATCPCGQELDVCRRAHCPRCGLRLTGAHSQVA